MLEPVDWWQDGGLDQVTSVYIAGWEFSYAVDVAEVMAHTEAITTPDHLTVGTPRWREWLLGRVAVAQAATRAGLGRVDVAVAESGAPFLRDCDWKVSIAHTRGLVLGAVCPVSIGIDVERKDRNGARLVKALSPQERDAAVSLGVIPTVVAKEAAAKATSLGLGGSLARWALVDFELCGSSPTVGIASPDGRIIDVRIHEWKDYVIGIASIGGGIRSR